MHNLIKRARAKTPPFFTKLRAISLAIAGVATALLTAPVTLPAAIITAAGYLLTAGTVATIISQLTVNKEETAIPKKAPKTGGKNGHNSKS